MISSMLVSNVVLSQFLGICPFLGVFKGMRMGGQMGGDRVTTHNLQVLKVIPEHNLLLIKGSVPGCKGSIVIIEK